MILHSPVQGFIGAFFSTLVFAFIAGHYMAQYKFFTCEIPGNSIPPEGLDCPDDPIFITRDYAVPIQLQSVIEKVGSSSFMSALHKAGGRADGFPLLTFNPDTPMADWRNPCRSSAADAFAASYFGHCNLCILGGPIWWFLRQWT